MKFLVNNLKKHIKNNKNLWVNKRGCNPPHYTPTLIFHGDGDTTVDPQMVILFNEKMEKNGNLCQLYLYEGEKHGFFNYGKKFNGAFIDTVNKIDQFLVEIGYLYSPPKYIFK